MFYCAHDPAYALFLSQRLATDDRKTSPAEWMIFAAVSLLAAASLGLSATVS